MTTVPAHRVRYTRHEYLALEATSNVKHEFLDGQIYAMAGGTPEHASLAAAVSGLLFGQLRTGRCRVLDADLRVHVVETGLTTYPDVTVVCGPWARSVDDPHAVTNPTVIVEVLSSSTESYDRGDKFEHYKLIPSLQQYVLVSPGRETVEVWSRRDGEWAHEAHGGGSSVDLVSIRAEFQVQELFEAAAEPTE